MGSAPRAPTKRVFGQDVQMIRTHAGDVSVMTYKFVQLYIERGGANAAKCARDAGYSENTAGSIASDLLHDERVLQLIDHAARAKLRAAVAVAADQLRQLMISGSAGDTVKVRACEAVLDRASKLLQKVSEQHIVVEDNRDRRTKLLRIVELAREQGMDPKKLLGSLNGIIDADFEVLEPGADQKALPSPAVEFEEIDAEAEDEEHSTEGLEGIL